MASLKSLVAEHGFGIEVRAKETHYKRQFRVIKDNPLFPEDSYLVNEDGAVYSVLKECDSTDDYVLVDND